MVCVNPFPLCSKHIQKPKSTLEARKKSISRTKPRSAAKDSDTSVCSRPERKNDMQKPVSRIISLLAVEDWEVPDTSLLERLGDELSDSDYVMVEDREWSDDELMDDARPGRRCVADDRGVKASKNVQEAGAMTMSDGDRRGEGEERKEVEEETIRPEAEDGE
jgi:hypothetical protein